MNKKILCAALLTIIFIGVICISCGKLNKKIYYAEPEANKVNLRILSNWNSFDKKSKTFQNLISDFNLKSDDTLITNDYVPGDDYLSHLKADFASANEPDIFISWPNTTVQQLFCANKIIGLNDILLKDYSWYDSFDKSIWKYVVYDGESYGMPLELSYVGFFANTDVLTNLGLSVPNTYNELVAQIPVLLKNDIVPIAMDISDNGMLLYKAITASLAGTFNIDYIYDSQKINPYYIKAGEYVKQLYEMNAFPKNLFSISEYEKDDLFINKKAAYIVHYSSFLSSACADNPDNLQTISITPFPRFDESLAAPISSLFGVSMDTIFVSSKSWQNPEKQDKILKLLKYLTSQDSAEYLVENLGIIPAVSIAHTPTYVSNPVYQKNYQYIHSATEIIDFPDYYTNSDVLINFADNFPDYLTDKCTIEELWINAYK